MLLVSHADSGLPALLVAADAATRSSAQWTFAASFVLQTLAVHFAKPHPSAFSVAGAAVALVGNIHPILHGEVVVAGFASWAGALAVATPCVPWRLAALHLAVLLLAAPAQTPQDLLVLVVVVFPTILQLLPATLALLLLALLLPALLLFAQLVDEPAFVVASVLPWRRTVAWRAPRFDLDLLVAVLAEPFAVTTLAVPALVVGAPCVAPRLAALLVGLLVSSAPWSGPLLAVLMLPTPLLVALLLLLLALLLLVVGPTPAVVFVCQRLPSLTEGVPCCGLVLLGARAAASAVVVVVGAAVGTPCFGAFAVLAPEVVAALPAAASPVVVVVGAAVGTPCFVAFAVLAPEVVAALPAAAFAVVVLVAAAVGAPCFGAFAVLAREVVAALPAAEFAVADAGAQCFGAFAVLAGEVVAALPVGLAASLPCLLGPLFAIAVHIAELSPAVQIAVADSEPCLAVVTVECEPPGLVGDWREGCRLELPRGSFPCSAQSRLVLVSKRGFGEELRTRCRLHGCCVRSIWTIHFFLFYLGLADKTQNYAKPTECGGLFLHHVLY